MGTVASQSTSFTIVYSTVYSDADQRKHQSSASLAFVWATQMASNAEFFLFDDVIMVVSTPVEAKLNGWSWQLSSRYRNSRNRYIHDVTLRHLWSVWIHDRLSIIYNYIDVIMGTMASQITSLTLCLLNRPFRRRSKKTSKPRVTGLCEGNSPVTDEFPAQMASNAENISICWRHHVRWQPASFADPIHTCIWDTSPIITVTSFVLADT